MIKKVSCRVCKTPATLFYKNQRNFYKCPVCSLLFTNEGAKREEAEKHYKGQWNDDEAFWRTQCKEILSVLNKYGVYKESKILDFGAGSGDITRELKKQGYDITPLEPMEDGYLKDQNYPQRFDAVIGIEVIEHIPNLHEELEQIKKILTPHGIMFFTTMLTNNFINTPEEKSIFESWWYKDDPTHVSFFSNTTLFKLAAILDYNVDIFQNQAFALYK